MRILALFAGGFGAAVLAFALGLGLLAMVLCGVVAAVAATSLFVLRKGWSKRAGILLLGVAGGLLWCSLYSSLHLRPLEVYDGVRMEITATAADYTKPGDYDSSTPVRVELDGKSYRAVLYGDMELDLEPGDRITGRAQLRRTGDTLGEEDIYSGARGYDLILTMEGTTSIARSDGTRLRDLPVIFGRILRETLGRLFPGEQGAYVTALITGDGSGLSETFYQQLARSGTRHIVAVSGMHVSILAGAILLLLGNRRRLGALICLPLIWFFTLAVGMPYSMVRASLMETVLLLAPLLRRENDPPTSLLTALMLILLPNPRAIADVGLQLSFLSVTGILLFSRKIFNAIWNLRLVEILRGRSRAAGYVLRVVLSGVAASFSVIPTTLPLSVYYFGLFSLVAPLSSALILPAISVCFSGSILSAMLFLLWQPLGSLVAAGVGIAVQYAMDMTRFLADLPFAAVSDESGYLLIFLAGVYLIVTYLACSRRRCRPLVPVGCLSALFCLCLLLGTVEYDRADFSVTAIDVGQGQCIYLESKGCAAMYDCGGWDEPGQTAVQYLQSIGRLHLDYLVISHYDTDHVGGVADLLRLISVDTLYLPHALEETAVEEEILQAAEAQGCQTVYVEQDLSIPFGAGTAWIFAPLSEESDNDASVTSLWRVGETDVLLTGDLSSLMEKKLVYQKNIQDVEILVAGHHGSASSTGLSLLETIEPEVVVISVGENNPYGHPAEETLERLALSGAEVYRTDQCGTITIRR